MHIRRSMNIVKHIIINTFKEVDLESFCDGEWHDDNSVEEGATFHCPSCCQCCSDAADRGEYHDDDHCNCLTNRSPFHG